MLMAALACGATASATAQSSPHARSVLGPWVGTYVCSQGLTGLTLSITEATPAQQEWVETYGVDDPAAAGAPAAKHRTAPGAGVTRGKGVDR